MNNSTIPYASYLFPCFSGPKTNSIKSIDSLLTILLIKIADTNRFIRADSNAAIESMAENLTIHKVVTLLDSKGARHKNIPAKATAARIFGTIVDAIGGERFITMAIASQEKDSKVVSIIVKIDHTVPTRNFLMTPLGVYLL